MKIPQCIFSTIVWLFLFLFFFHGWCDFFSNNNNNIIHNNNDVDASPLRWSSRKMLISKVDFSPFTSRHRHHHRHIPVHPEPTSSEIDPLYGAEKRLVPTGPNPLHH